MKTLVALGQLCSSRLANSLALAVIVIAFALPAAAAQIVLDFDSGFYDPNITANEPGTHCPCDYLEDGARIAGFWAENVGDPSGRFIQGHTHLGTSNYTGNTGNAERQHAWTSDLQGVFISLESGATFDLVSADYRIRKRTSSDPNEQLLPWSFAIDDVQMLVSTSFDPTLADFESQWTAIDIDDGTHHRRNGIASLPGEVPFQTHLFSGLEGITGFYLSSTAFTSFDNITLQVMTPNPEPSTGLLVALGLGGLAAQRKRVRGR